jgi:hypothetical protein
VRTLKAQCTGLAFYSLSMKTTTQENGYGCRIRFRCVRDDLFYVGKGKGMVDKRLDHLARVSAALPLGKNGVADLDCA